MISTLRIFTVAAAFVVFAAPFASVEAKTDREKAMKECRKELDWPNLPGKVKKSPMKIAELDACIKKKMGD